MKWYGSIENRLEENQNQLCEKVVGGLLTEFSYTDRTPYEITKVDNQKHIWVRRLDHKKADDIPMSNNWTLFSNENNPEIEMVYRYNKWNFAYKNVEDKLIYRHANVTFGYADYYYDYSF